MNQENNTISSNTPMDSGTRNPQIGGIATYTATLQDWKNMEAMGLNEAEKLEASRFTKRIFPNSELKEELSKMGVHETRQNLADLHIEGYVCVLMLQKDKTKKYCAAKIAIENGRMVLSHHFPETNSDTEVDARAKFMLGLWKVGLVKFDPNYFNPPK